MCLDPAQHLNAVTKPLRGCVYFSATLSPLSDMRAFLGGDADDAMLSLPSPFPQENLLILRRDHATSYSARASTTRAVADTLAVFARACRGNLWACFPSYAYMNAVRAALLQIAPELSILAQSSRMSEAERGAFLDAFYSGGRMMGMIALGGSFGESVDLVGDRLSGVAIVGVGLPQVGPEREILRAYYEERVGDGFAYAYRIPGMHKVVQAAGRVIRSADDRGAVLLIDDRYARDEYIELLPPHWRDIYIARDDDQLRRRLDEFWNQC
jgi:DNA excision repair protein ERCC-2